MTEPQSYWRPQVYPPPYPSAAPWSTSPNAQSHAHEPLFQVRLTKHTGLVFASFDQSSTFTGTFAQCEHAVSQAQQHNLLAGWWSIASILVWNWVALAANRSARKALRDSARVVLR